jgi:hypothetical protein
MRGHRILTLFAVEAAAMFALCAATSIPAASSASAASAEHLKAASSVSAIAPNTGRMYEPDPSEEGGDGNQGIEEGRDQGEGPKSRQQDDTSVRVKVRQNHKSHSHSEGHNQHCAHARCFHCHHHAKPRVVHAAPAPAPAKLPFTGRNSAKMAVGGGAAVLTGVVLLWLSSVRRKRLPGSKSAVVSAV